MSDDLTPTPAEQQLIDAAKRGVIAELQSTDKAANDPANGSTWGPERTVRATVICTLATNRRQDWPVHPHGVQLKGAKIVGNLDFKADDIPHPLALLGCFVEERINFQSASAHSIFLTGSHIPGMDANELRTRYQVSLDQAFTSKGELSLRDAHIGGILRCVGAKFDNPGGIALAAERITVQSAVLLRNGFRAQGEVRLMGARIRGDLDCVKGTFENPKGNALSADRLTVEGSVYLRDCKATGAVRLLAAKISGTLSCVQGSFENPDDNALHADRLTIEGSVFLRDCKATGAVRLLGAKIRGDLDCDKGIFENAKGNALTADRVTVEGGIFLRECKAKGAIRLLGAKVSGNLDCVKGIFENATKFAINGDNITISGSAFLREGFNASGEVRLTGANIGSSLECSGGTFNNPGGRALAADRATIRGSVFLSRGFTAMGEVRLLGSNIGSNFECSGGTFQNAGGKALNAERIAVGGHVFLRDGFTAIGETQISGAKIKGDIRCDRGTFDNPGKLSLDLQGANVGGSLRLQSLAARPSGTVDLSFAVCGQLADDSASWPATGFLVLQGLVYDNLAGSTDAKSRRDWLNLQTKAQFNPQPYEQLIRVLREMGHDRDAQKIGIAKQAALRRSGELDWLRWFWNWVLAITVRYGYHPTLIIAWMVPIVLFGAWIFAHAYQSCLMVPTKERIYLDKAYNCLEGSWILPPEYPRFHSIVYSLDVFFPVVDLRQKAYWEPSDTTEDGLIITYRKYFWLHTVVGWLLTALAVAGVTRVVKRD